MCDGSRMGERWKEREGNRYKDSAGGNESVEEMYWRRSADRQTDRQTYTHAHIETITFTTTHYVSVVARNPA